MTLILLCCVGILSVRDKEPVSAGAEKRLLYGMPATEIPQEALRLLGDATPGRRVALVSQFIEELKDEKEGVLPFLISTIARHFPELAGVTVVETITFRPEQTVTMVKAALLGAPEQGENVVVETIRNAPEHFPLVTLIVASCQPERGEAIVMAIARTLPEAQPALEKALNRQRHYPLDVREVLNEAEQTLAEQAATRSGPQNVRANVSDMGNNGSSAENQKGRYSCLIAIAKARLNHSHSPARVDTKQPMLNRVPLSQRIGAPASGGISLHSPGSNEVREVESHVEVR